jgi:UDP-N-acetylmuramyl pentapeptide phosphotransferase/UDP-N-acetylglucosamine-1-phosphate transferase
MLLLASAGLAGCLSAALIVLLRPLLQRYALARPNARSSHRIPTPQGGGIAVVGAGLLVAVCGALLAGLPLSSLAVVAAAALALAVVGAVDDIRPLPAVPRLLIQVAAVAVLVGLAGEGRVLPDTVPLPLEQALLILGGAWFVNLVNFMDGLDWMTVAEVVPVTAALACFGLAGVLPMVPALLAAALLGATLGFAPFNRPVARLFLGDVGSLPIGLMLGWMLLELARAGGLAAALLLPLYYLADATITLALRLARRERVWEAHRTHFYQRATDHGHSVLAIDGAVLAVNGALAGLAALTLALPHPAVQAGALGLGLLLVAGLLARFSKPPKGSPPA